MQNEMTREDLEREVFGFFKRGRTINAYEAAEKWGFDDDQEFRMFIHQLRNKLDVSIHPTFWGPNQPGEYKLLTSFSDLKGQTLKSFKRGAGYMERSGRRSYRQCQEAARKLLPSLPEQERDELLDEMMALEASLGNAYIIVSNICRRLEAPAGSDMPLQMRLLTGAESTDGEAS